MNQHDAFNCPCCGAELPAEATFCRECGASDEFGWGDEAGNDDLPAGYAGEDDFDYDEYVRREFPGHGEEWSRESWKKLAVGLIVLLTCAGLLMLALGF